MPYRVHKKVDDLDVVYTSPLAANEDDGETDITSTATPALQSGGVNGTFRDAVYGEDAAAELELSKSTNPPKSGKAAAKTAQTAKTEGSN